jgi:dienelactone hydrolase
VITNTSGNTLDGYQKSQFRSAKGVSHDVHRIGTGPAVIVIHEIPGITPPVAEFGRKIADRGMTAVLPDLFGTPSRPVSFSYVLSSFARTCVSKEFTLLALNKTSPVVDFLRELAKHEHKAHGGPGVGALGSECASRLDRIAPARRELISHRASAH